MQNFFSQVVTTCKRFMINGNKLRFISWVILTGLVLAAGIIGVNIFSYKWSGILNEEERDWIKKHPVVTFAPDPDFPPIEFFDEKGNYNGLVAEYFTLIERNLGIDIQIIELGSWEQVLDFARNRKVDGITAAQITPDRLEYLSYTTPIMDIPNVIITRKGADNQLNLTFEKMDGMEIAITHGYAIEEYLRKHYPAITVLTVNNDLQALEWVSFDRADATVVNLAIASYLINEHGFTNLLIAGDSGRKNPLSIATRSDEPILREIMEKGIRSISEKDKKAIYSKWIGLSYMDMQYPGKALTVTFWVLAGLALLVFVSIFWNMSLHSQVNHKTSELNHELNIRKATENRLSQQLENLSALRAVSVAINASMDLPLTLNILLDQVSSKLKVDACDVLLLNPHTRTLDFAADRGFRTKVIRGTSLNMGNSFAWQAVQSRSVIRIDNLLEDSSPRFRTAIHESEGFVSYIGAPLISKGMIKGVLEIFMRSPLQFNRDWMDFLEAMVSQAAIALDNGSMFQDLQKANLDLTLAYDATIEGWAKALELRDGGTEGHSQRVTQMTLKLAQVMGVQDSDLEHIRRGALLHDIGKMGVPDSILLKEGSLDDMEWEMMRKHPVFAMDMLKNISYLQPALDIPCCHHERWDGSGYPQGLSGNQIPFPARIFSVIDVWDALSSDRPYRGPWKEEDVYTYIRENSGSQFDPLVVQQFFNLLQM